MLIIVVFSTNLIASKYDTDSLQQVLHITNQPSEKITILNLLAKAYIDKDPVKANNYAGQALFFSQSIDNTKGKSEALYYMAIYSMKNKDFIEALNQLLQSKEGFEKIGDEVWKAKVFLELGKVYKRRFEFEKTLAVFYEAMNIFIELKKDKELADTYNAIGGAYYDQNNYDKAYEYFNKSLLLNQELNNLRGIAALNNNIGEIYRFRSQFDEALRHYQKAIEFNKDITDSNYLAVNYDNIGNVYLEKKEFDSAIYYLNRSLVISNNIQNEERLSSVNNSLGKLYLRLNKNDKGLELFKKGYEFALKNKLLINTKDASYGLSEIYSRKSQFENAFIYYQEYKQISDSLYNISNLEKITQLEMQFVFEHEQKLNKIRKQKTGLRYFMVSAGLISLLIILILLIGRQRIIIKYSNAKNENLELEKKQLNEDINFKNRELATNVMYLVKKNEFINFISEKLLRIKSNFKKENQPVIHGIILNLQSSVDKDIWKTFEQRFKGVHNEFYQKLLKNFPKLTENDKRICALLRLNMSTKDIAAIVHQNPSSIEVSRTRLRKKLGLSNKKINLITFLTNL
ncbi:MAG: tetratricopeptide repeat protein [Bacteroidales bacterium]|nr:tetratricopeptide repeat protein [Bacteroidales bacterium]